MTIEKLTIHVSESLGTVSGELMKGDDVKVLFVFAHGAGAPMNHPFMVNLSRALASFEIATLRFNFPYMEKGGKRPDPPAIAEKTVNRAIALAHERYPAVPILAGGKSFGGRMASHALARAGNTPVKGLVFTGFPLHPPGKPGTDRAAHLEAISMPMLFLQGTRDALANMELMEKVCTALPAATLKRFEGADHSFKAGKTDLIPVLAESIRDWISVFIRR